MTAHDPYPQVIEFDIDRKRLRRYLRLVSLLGCCGTTIALALMFTIPVLTRYLEEHDFPGIGGIVMIELRYVGIAFAIGLLAGLAIYAIGFHLPSTWASNNLRLRVEGTHLRLVSGAVIVTDRRMHFRAVRDYSTRTGPVLRRCGMKALCINVGDAPSSNLCVIGLDDPEAICDQLCAIDAAREQ